MNIYSIYSFIFKYTRKKRMQLFLKTMCPQEGATVLDIGGTRLNWKYVDKKLDITLLNLTMPKDADSYPSNFKCVVGNGANLDYQDKSFDIVFCNSVIEHVSPQAEQYKFAKEAMRVGKKLFLQTPSKYFFIEPHLLTFFIHYFPKKITKMLARFLSVKGIISKMKKSELDLFIDEINLLSLNEIKNMFKECTYLINKYFFVPKEYIVIRK